MFADAERGWVGAHPPGEPDWGASRRHNFDDWNIALAVIREVDDRAIDGSGP